MDGGGRGWKDGWERRCVRGMALLCFGWCGVMYNVVMCVVVKKRRTASK